MESKIYSRQRFCTTGKGYKNMPRNNRRYTVISIITIIVIAVITFVIITRAVNPIINDLCIDKAKNIATQISNDEATLIMNQYSYDDLITIVRDSNGNVKMLQTNTKNVNKIISDIPLNIINKFQEKNTSDIFIYLGSALGLKLFSAQGPKIHIKIANVGNVDTKLVSEFTSQGINQTLHRVYVNFNCDMAVVTPMKRYNQNVVNQFIIAEHVIVGNIPDSYYNLEGIESSMDTMDILK